MMVAMEMQAIHARSVKVNGVVDILTNVIPAGLNLVRNMVKYAANAMVTFVLIVTKKIHVIIVQTSS